MLNELTADYVVVGSGAGGGPLAARLALAGFEVLVLEAGEDRADRLTYQVPAFHPLASEDPTMSWEFFVQHYTAPERQSADYDPKYEKAEGGIFYPRAGTLGGCTAHNALITVYPHNSDWQKMADALDDPSWGPKGMRAYFERLERCGYVPQPRDPDDNPSRHGFGGWLGTQQADPRLAVGDRELLKVITSAAVTTLLELLVQDLVPFPVHKFRAFQLSPGGAAVNSLGRQAQERKAHLGFEPRRGASGHGLPDFTGAPSGLDTKTFAVPSSLGLAAQAIDCRPSGA